SLPQMRRFLQYALLGGLLGMGVVIFLGLGDPSTATTGQAADSPSAAHKSYVETVPGSNVKFEMIAIPGGTYLMGSPSSEPGHADDEDPQHPVTLRPFWMGKTEVTWDEYD